MGLPWWLSSKEFASSAGDSGDTGSIPGSGRSPGVANGNLLPLSCLENSTDKRVWWATVHGGAKSQTRLSDWAHGCFYTISLTLNYSKEDNSAIYLFNWGEIALQCCVGFCHTIAQSSHNYTCIVSLSSLSSLPPSHPSRSSQSTRLGTGATASGTGTQAPCVI